MRLTRIEIQSLPGIATGFTVDGFAEGVTLVTGPNASGKSSLLRALRYLLGGPQPGDPPALVLAAGFVDEAGRRWDVHRAGRELGWRCNGQPVEPPPLPEPDALHAYLMRIEDLVVAQSGHDRTLSERLRLELHGGYDLDPLRRPPFHFGERKGATERNALNTARQQRRTIEREYETLLREEQELPELDARIEQSRLAPERLRRVEQALERLDLAEQLDALELKLGHFAPGMQDLRGDEQQRLDENEQRALEYRKRRTDELAALRRVEGELAATGIGQQRPSDELLEQQARQLAVLEQHIEARDRARDQQQAARQQLHQAAAGLGASTDAAGLPRLSPDAVADAEALARELQRAQDRRDRLRAVIDTAAAAPDPARIRELQRGLDALAGWLAEPDTHSAPVGTAAMMSALGGAAALAVWAVPIHAPHWPPLPEWLLPSGGLLALLASVWLALGRRPGPRRRHRSAYLECALPPPAEWSRSEVAALKHELQDQLDRLEAQRRSAEHAAQLATELEAAQGELDALEQHRLGLAARIGFDPRLSAAGFDRFVRLTEQYQHAELEFTEAGRSIERLSAEIERLQREIGATLQRWTQTDPAPESIESLNASLSELRRRCITADQARQRIEDLRERIELSSAELEQLTEQRQRLMRQAGIEPEDPAELARRIDRLDDWRQLQAARERLLIDLERLDRALQDQAEFKQAVARRDRSGLQQLQSQTRTQADEHQQLLDRRARLRARLDAAGTDRRLARALAEEADARDRLDDLQRQALAAECSGLLLEEIERDFRQHHEPALLRAARTRFAAFTHHAWDLSLGNGPADRQDFRAIETASGVEHALTELSTATRMQLLLALRTSWAEHQEQGRSALPFMLDEALTTSDPERFASVAASLQQLADECGRQIIYLAAGAHEAWLWQQATGQAPHQIDLAALRCGFERAEFTAMPAPTAPALPAPDGLEAHEYARLIDVPRLDPRMDAGRQHPYWVLDDRLELLHRLVSVWRIQRIGALRRLLEGPRAAIALPDSDERNRVLARIELLQCWIEVWRIGRGRPLDRAALQQADGITDKMLEPVSKAAEACDSDAARLVEALRQGLVPGFRKNKLEEFEHWLTDQGYVDPRAALDPAARRERVLERCPQMLDIGAAQALIDLIEHAVTAAEESGPDPA
ncbi:MAG: hypothetical protein CVV18_01135 [Gammaproteobacteria bacterium HGW-Gammaproteobacteria-8]|nr:MAG: hypothetical protein CVV18_01135 [Gammaproteobacteria bacterium HGW-Gammaproteobacteria-8]